MEKWQAIRHLASMGKSGRFISKVLAVSRYTVAKAVAEDVAPGYKRPAVAKQELECYRQCVQEGLARGLSGERLLATACESGYSGSRATFYRWLDGIRKEAAAGQSSCRFETGPADQSQFDWSPYRLDIGGIKQSIIIYSQMLGYSRRVHWYPSVSERQESVHEAVEAGWRHFGGCCRYLLIDNAKSMVLRHRAGEVHWNAAFLALCGHYRVQPIAATPRHPQTKGKVENAFRVLENRLLKGGSWRDFLHLHEHLAAFEAGWEQRVHQTTRVVPMVRFEEERSQLLRLPTAVFQGAPNMLRIVNNDGLFSFGNVRYCVPAVAAGASVRVRTQQGRELLVFDLSGNEIIRHPIAPAGSAPQYRSECYEIHKGRRRANLAGLTTEFRSRYGIHATCTAYLQLLLAGHPNRPEDALARVLALLEHVPGSVAVATLSDAVEYNLPHPKALEEFLTRRLRNTQTDLEPSPVSGSAGRLPDLDVERELSSYARFLPQEENR